MSSRGRRVAFFALGLVACRSRCGDPPSPAPVVDAAPIDAGGPTLDAGATEPAEPADASVTARIGAEILQSELLPNGHVLVTTQRSIWDWDTTAADAGLRRIPLGGEGGDPTPYVGFGSVFVVERVDQTSRSLEVWNVAEGAKVKTFAGRWSAAQSAAAVAKNKRHFLLAVCEAEASDWETCAVGVYALPSGALVHRTHMPALRFERYFASFRLSPNGAFFGFSHGWLASMVYRVQTGDLVHPADGKLDPELQDVSAPSIVSLDDRRVVIEENARGKYTLTSFVEDLESGTFDAELGRNDFARDATVSPDGKRMAVLLEQRALATIAIWDLADKSVKKHRLPGTLCAHGCSIRWANDHKIDLHVRPERSSDRSPKRIHVDVASGAQTADPEKMPSLARGGFQVWFDADRSIPEKADIPASVDTIVTPDGTRRDVPALELPLASHAVDAAFLDVVGGRLLLRGRSKLRVIARDGVVRELEGG
ncbi:MAG: hypothetical protein KIT84_28965 [Labilithrix sp.]|nr:hypothetical protein [Labilithrix sp.]MCW5815092.1 hypothetical protein [Labilithrix sp.]